VTSGVGGAATVFPNHGRTETVYRGLQGIFRREYAPIKAHFPAPSALPRPCRELSRGLGLKLIRKSIPPYSKSLLKAVGHPKE